MIYICEPTRIAKPRIISHITKTRCFCSITFCDMRTLRYSKNHIASIPSRANPYFILFICNGIRITNNRKLFSSFHDPCKEFTEQTKRRICDNNIRFIAQSGYFGRTEVAVTFEVTPLQVVNVNSTAVVGIVCKCKYFALDTAFLYVVQRIFCFKECRLPIGLVLFAFYGVWSRNEFLQTEELKVLCKELGKVAPFRIIARQQDCLAPKDIGVVFNVCVYFFLYVRILGVKLIVFSILRCS